MATRLTKVTVQEIVTSIFTTVNYIHFKLFSVYTSYKQAVLHQIDKLIEM